MAQASAEKLEHTVTAEKKGVASMSQREQLASMPSRLCQKEKEQSRQFRIPEREMGESQGGRDPYLSKTEGNQNVRMESKR